jgi:hypothetical protein
MVELVGYLSEHLRSNRRGVLSGRDGAIFGVTMRILWASLLLLVVSSAYADEVDVAAGTEYFVWEEFTDGGSKLLDETGMRYFVSVVGTNHLNRDWSMDFGGRLYSGTVDYDGRTMGGTPVKTDTEYSGSIVELGITRYTQGRRKLATGEWLIRFALGSERWRRGLLDSHDIYGNPVSGYVERYLSNYAKVGATYRIEGHWEAGFGAKAPFFTSEKASLSGTDVSLNPEGQLSLYAHVAMPLAGPWSVSFDYDSYRFAKSDPDNGYYQPESNLDTLGAAIHYRF